MVQILLRYESELRCQLEHGPSATLLDTDAPLDNMGKGQSFSPTDLCAASLVSCIVTTMGILARKNGFELQACEASVQKIMTSVPTRRIAELPVSIQLHGRYSEEQMSILRKAAETCPVKESLSPSIVVTIDWQLDS